MSVASGEQVTCYGRTQATDSEGEWRQVTSAVYSGTETEFRLRSSTGKDIIANDGDIGGPCINNNQFVGINSSYRSWSNISTPFGGTSGTIVLPKTYESVHDATARYAKEILDLTGDPTTIVHAPNGDFGNSHEDSFVHYVSWDDQNWCARIYGNTFVHARACNWRDAHSDSIINYKNIDNTLWTATVNSRVFTHAPSGDFTQSHTDTILTYQIDGSSWTMRLK